MLEEYMLNLGYNNKEITKIINTTNITIKTQNIEESFFYV